MGSPLILTLKKLTRSVFRCVSDPIDRETSLDSDFFAFNSFAGTNFVVRQPGKVISRFDL